MIMHCVLVRFRSEVQAEEKQAIYDGIAALQSVIDGIVDVKAGPNVSPEGLDCGYMDGFVVTFENAGARDTYLDHPDHKAVGYKLVEAAAGGQSGILVFDWKV
ncbi:Dabb family protein [Martelella mediterranea]|uniref:Stress responsive alpha/beta barrel protein n=1 Tax=Martelella mediterranea TaxID=293089 RepID=A0A4R3NP70_9HYPH|nr:Dabb family protein [Martelella mediterranea]TCT37311.1 stress responsive alpha/beta barrel protein [Martelella mediterranea]